MKARIEVAKLNPKVVQSLRGLGALVEQSGLEHKLLHLIMMRASQINGCAYCIDMHAKDARAWVAATSVTASVQASGRAGPVLRQGDRKPHACRCTH
jgi:AhpD family alkylhydroperoxidase